MGKETALQLQDIVSKAAIGNKGQLAFITGVIILFVGATTVFADIQESINTIWGLKPKPKRGLLKILKSRFLSFLVIILLWTYYSSMIFIWGQSLLRLMQLLMVLKFALQLMR
jgi:membrane protein